MSRTSSAALVIGAAAPIALAAIAKIPSKPEGPTPANRIVVVQPTPAASAAVATTAPPAPSAATTAPPVVSDIDVATCLARYKGIDLPFTRGDDAASTQRIVCRRGYVLSYNSATHSPDWVLERLTAAELRGPAKRKDNFKEDPLLNALDADDTDYVPRVYDRGHQAPAADAAFDQKVNDQSFFFSNMSPQVGIGFNRGIWRVLEETVRSWVLCGGHDELYVITGPIYENPKGVIGHDKLIVPGSFYKIVYDPKAVRVVGFVLENTKIGSRFDEPQKYVKAIADIEADTGIDFFKSWPLRQQRLLEASPGTAWGRAEKCDGAAGAD